MNLVYSRNIFLWRNTLWILWQTALCPLKAWKMVRRDRRHGRKQRNSVPGWTPGNSSIYSRCQPASPFISSSPSLLRHRGPNCARTFLWVTRKWGATVMCSPAIHKVTLMGLVYDHFPWLCSKTTSRSIGPQLSSKLLPWHCQIFIGVQDVC